MLVLTAAINLIAPAVPCTTSVSQEAVSPAHRFVTAMMTARTAQMKSQHCALYIHAMFSQTCIHIWQIWYTFYITNKATQLSMHNI